MLARFDDLECVMIPNCLIPGDEEHAIESKSGNSKPEHR